MKVFLLKDIEQVGISGEMLEVVNGFARNYLIPRKLAVQVTKANEPFYKKRTRTVEDRKEAIASKTSMLAEKIGKIKLTLKRKTHDDGKLYGSVGQGEICDLLAEAGISVAKNKIIFDKSIKEKGSYKVTIKLTSTLQPKVTVTVVPEAAA